MAQPTKCCLCKHEASNLEYNKIGLGSIPIILALRGGGGKEGRPIILALDEWGEKVCP